MFYVHTDTGEKYLCRDGRAVEDCEAAMAVLGAKTTVEPVKGDVIKISGHSSREALDYAMAQALILGVPGQQPVMPQIDWVDLISTVRRIRTELQRDFDMANRQQAASTVVIQADISCGVNQLLEILQLVRGGVSSLLERTDPTPRKPEPDEIIGTPSGWLRNFGSGAGINVTITGIDLTQLAAVIEKIAARCVTGIVVLGDADRTEIISAAVNAVKDRLSRIPRPGDI